MCLGLWPVGHLVSHPTMDPSSALLCGAQLLVHSGCHIIKLQRATPKAMACWNVCTVPWRWLHSSSLLSVWLMSFCWCSLASGPTLSLTRTVCLQTWPYTICHGDQVSFFSEKLPLMFPAFQPLHSPQEPTLLPRLDSAVTLSSLMTLSIDLFNCPTGVYLCLLFPSTVVSLQFSVMISILNVLLSSHSVMLPTCLLILTCDYFCPYFCVCMFFRCIGSFFKNQ